MKLKYLIPLLALLASPAEAQSMGSGINNPGAAGAIPSLPVPVADGGTGATSLGPTITNAGSALNTTNNLITLSGTTDAISCATVMGGTVDFTNSSGDAATIAAATSTGCTSGFGVVVNNLSTSYSTITPTTSTIGGTASLSLPPSTSCYVFSDGTNYQVGLCQALTRIQNVGGSAVGWTQTGQSTSNYICLTNVVVPPLGPHDQIYITPYWSRSATTTDTVRFSMTLATAGSTCTPGSSTGITGTQFIAVDQSTSGIIGQWTPTLINNTATNVQIAWPAASAGNLSSSGAPTTAAIQTNTGAVIQFACRTTTSTSDTCGLNWYDVQVIRNP